MTFVSICVLCFMLVLMGWITYEAFNNHFQRKIALQRDGVYIVRVGDRQFNVYLTREGFRKLEELRNATGKKTLGETLRCAMKLYNKEEHGE